LKGAGLEAVAIDAAPLAVMRVLPTQTEPGTDGGAEALVAIGAEMMTVAVRQNGMPRFIRSLAIGGAKLTRDIATASHVEPAVAERLKRETTPGSSPQLAQARRAVTTELRDLAEQVKATLDFFAAQSDGVPVDRLFVTGGAAQTTGLVEALTNEMKMLVELVDPFGPYELEQLGLDDAQLARARGSAATAIGLAQWGYEAPEHRLSVLPDEVAAESVISVRASPVSPSCSGSSPSSRCPQSITPGARCTWPNSKSQTRALTWPPSRRPRRCTARCWPGKPWWSPP
jgi:cell division ATPase FtsA